MSINKLRFKLYNAIEEKGLRDKDTLKISKELDKLILKDFKKYNKVS